MSAVKAASEDCPHCDGDGFVMIPFQRPTRSAYYPDGMELDERPEECPACGGMGIRLPQTPEEAGVRGGDHSAPQ